MSMSIGARILTLFIVATSVPLVTVGLITYGTVSNTGDETIVSSREALRDQAVDRLEAVAVDIASGANEFFDSISSDLSYLQDSATEIFASPDVFLNGTYPATNYSTDLATGLPTYGYEKLSGPAAGAWADWDHQIQGTPYLNASVVSRASTDSAYAAEVSEMTDLSMRLDPMLKSVYEKHDPHVVLTWTVLLGGISNSYSVPALDWFDELASGGIDPTWNEADEEYVVIADRINNPDREIVTTTPYYDPLVDGWLISFVAPVYRGPEFIGVIGIDLQLDSLNARVEDVALYDSGFGFIIDDTGATLAHQDVEEAIADLPSGEETVPITDLVDDGNEFQEVVDAMLDGESGSAEVEFDDGSNNFVAYAQMDQVPFSVGVVVSQEEVLAPVEESAESISEGTSRTIGWVVFIDILFVAIAIAVAVLVTRHIVLPINALIAMAEKLGQGEIHEEMFEEDELEVEEALKERSDEIGDLAESFSDMMQAIRKDIKESKKEVNIEIRDSVIYNSEING